MKKLLSILLIATCAFATAMALEGSTTVQPQSVSDDFCSGTQVHISADVVQGYEFMGWSNDASSTQPRAIVSPDNPATITVPSADITYYAVWGNKVFYKANPDYPQVTLNTGITNPVIAESGINYTILDNNYTENDCASITGYKVYAATDDQGNYDKNSPLHTLAKGASFMLTQNVVIVPEIDPGTITVTIVSENPSWGTVSFTNTTQNQ